MVKDSCGVVDCNEQKAGDITLHKVPTDKIDADVWMYFLQRSNEKYPTWKPIKKMVVCSKHFLQDDFRMGASGKRFVIPGHYPYVHQNLNFKSEIQTKFGLVDELVTVDEVDEDQQPVIMNVHSKCNEIIKSQMLMIAELRRKLTEVTQENNLLKDEIHEIKSKTIKNFKMCVRRHDDIFKRKNAEKTDLEKEIKRLKSEVILPPPSTQADSLLLELIARRNIPKFTPYSDKMRQFAFSSLFISPKGYRHLQANFPALLPYPSSCSRWIKDVHVSPGLLKLSFQEIKRCSSGNKPLYYSLSFDEIAIRQQLLFDGNKMTGQTDYGGMSEDEDKGLAKSALFCLCTEINGRKSFPLAYILTAGLKSNVFAEFVKTCIENVFLNGGIVLSITFDGLRSNFAAMEKLGAKLIIGSDEYKPQLQFGTRIVHVIPDASHMIKLVRNTMDKVKNIYNGDGQIISWKYISALQKLQDKEGLRPATKLTGLHVNYHTKKMSTKLCVQTLSSSTASGIDFCRRIGIEEFEGSSATTEFLRVVDMIFDMLNTRPYGKGKKTPLSKHNIDCWRSIISSSQDYLIALKLYDGTNFTPLFLTKYGTCVKGLIAALTSIQNIMDEIDSGVLSLFYLPTYRLSQDPIELFFGTLRSRLGANDNPNVVQLAYTVRAMLCFKLRTCVNGNCDPQEDLLWPVRQDGDLIEVSDQGESEECDEEDAQVYIQSVTNLSLFVENIVVYIAGFVGKRLKEKIDCDDCVSALRTLDIEYMQLREDYSLILEKDRGGLFKPSEDLIVICKIAERVIRLEEVKEF